MHLRGPMNISQLAVYQLPSDMHAVGKRETVPFYNRRRAMNKRDFVLTGQDRSRDVPDLPLGKRTTNTTVGCGPRTVTYTTTITDCASTHAIELIKPLLKPNYAGPAIPCMPTSSPSWPAANLIRPESHSVYIPSGRQLPVARPFPTKHTVVNEKAKAVRRAVADWGRVAYYNSAAPAQATGMSFLANRGDPRKSGTFD